MYCPSGIKVNDGFPGTAETAGAAGVAAAPAFAGVGWGVVAADAVVGAGVAAGFGAGHGVPAFAAVAGAAAGAAAGADVAVVVAGFGLKIPLNFASAAATVVPVEASVVALPLIVFET